MDLVVGNADGKLRAFRNDGGTFTWLTGTANPFDGIVAPEAASPTFVDLDRDGDPDLVVGDRWGGLRVFRNDGHGIFTALTGSSQSLRRNPSRRQQRAGLRRF